MKVIDLLNKIAKGEKVPNKIRVNDTDFTVYRVAPITDYQVSNGDSNYLFQDYIFSWGSVVFNDEVEIIEEEKEIEKIMCIDTRETRDCIIEFQNKINELIDEIKRLKRNINDSNV